MHCIACPQLAGGMLLPYYLDEKQGWSTSLEGLQAQVQKVGCAGWAGWAVSGVGLRREG